MRRNRKWILAILLVLGLSFILTACGSSASSDDPYSSYANWEYQGNDPWEGELSIVIKSITDGNMVWSFSDSFDNSVLTQEEITTVLQDGKGTFDIQGADENDENITFAYQGSIELKDKDFVITFDSGAVDSASPEGGSQTRIAEALEASGIDNEVTLDRNNLYRLAKFNGGINNFVWGVPMLILLIGTGIFMTLLTKVFQISHLKTWWKNTIGSVFTNKHVTAHTAKHDKSISQFQSLTTALAATIGTGNIVGVAAAIALGGPGAIFWMWIVAFFGMMTNYSENILGIYFRRKNKNDEWSGGAMYYLQDGLGGYKGSEKAPWTGKLLKWIGKILAILFACFCILASFGIGNASQINSIAANMDAAFGIPAWVVGIVLLILGGLIILGGLKRVASVTEKIVPFMAVIYIIAAIIVICVNGANVGPAFVAIFKGAFGLKAASGGIVGGGIALALTYGMKRGVFSNEAGLGSSVMVHSNSNVKEPVKQGMWGIFEVFADTIIVCTLTALVVLTSGVIDLNTGAVSAAYAHASTSTLVGQAFGTLFKGAGPAFVAIALLFFAFSTVLGWSHYGSKAFEYLFGEKAAIGYKIVFVLFIFVGATMDLALAWDISDTFNGLMAIPNLIGVLTLFPLVYKITKNYVDRKLKHKNIEPMISKFPDIQKMQVEALARGEEE